jgi:hypothetical protein
MGNPVDRSRLPVDRCGHPDTIDTEDSNLFSSSTTGSQTGGRLFTGLMGVQGVDAMDIDPVVHRNTSVLLVTSSYLQKRGKKKCNWSKPAVMRC